MHEIELRFHVPAAQRARLRRFIDQPDPAPRLRLAAVYYDSRDRQLARAGIGLRLRLEGERWVQTVKGPSEDGISRLEHNAELPPGAEPVLDLGRHAGHPLGERLQQFHAALQPVFRTEIQRASRRLRLPGAEIELAWDEGRLIAGKGRLAVHELELELLQGSVNALLEYAHGLVGELPLSLDLRSKAERGERLAGGQTQSPPRRLGNLSPQPDMAPAAALRAMLLQRFEQIAANASQIGSGDSEPGHGQQLRAGLRRLCSDLRPYCAPTPLHPALPDFERRAAAWLRELNGLRATVRQPAAQQFLLECLGWIHHLEEAPAGGR
jgi:triphosphatase